MEKKITIGYKCNNNCRFCDFLKKKGQYLILESIEKKLIQLSKKGVNKIILSGGEPTLRKDLLKIINRIKKIGMKVVLQTNGRVFASEKFTTMYKNKIDTFSIFLISDFISQTPNSFKQTIKGLKNLKNLNQDIELNIVINNYNYKKLSKLVLFIKKLGIRKIRFIYSEPVAGKENKFRSLVPEIHNAAPYIEEALKLIQKSDMVLLRNTEPYSYKKPNHLLKKDCKLKYQVKKDPCNKKVSVVIPTANRKPYLKKTLKALFKQDIPPEDYEIIIVDDNSKDNTEEMVRSLTPPCNLKYLYWPRKEDFTPGSPLNRAGPVRNAGVEHSNGDIIIFLDCDIIVKPSFISEHVKSHSKYDVIIGESIRENMGKDIREHYFKYCKDNIGNFPYPWTLMHEGNISFKRNIFLEEKGFSDEYVYWAIEGDDLAYRLYKKGIKFGLNRNAKGIHLNHPSESIGRDKFIEGMEYNTNVFYKKYLDKRIYDRFYLPGGFNKISDLETCVKQKFENIPGIQQLFFCLNDTKCSFINLCNAKPLLIRELISSDTGMKEVFFRSDDVAELTPLLKKLVNIFIKEDIPINLQIIPDKLTDECTKWLLDLAKKYSKIIELNQHGFQHKNYSKSDKLEDAYEFGKNRNYKQQYEDIKKGRNKLVGLFGDYFVPLFTPPFHGYDKNTLKAVENLKFNIFSKWSDAPLVNYFFKEVSPNIDIVMDYSKTKKIKQRDDIIREINNVKKEDSTIGILLHHNYLLEENIVELNNLIKLLKLNKSFRFKKMSHIKCQY